MKPTALNMKTKIVKMLALTVLAFVVIIISSSKKTKAADKAVVVTELKDIKHIHKIVVTGNVDLYLTQGTEENLKVYDNYYSKNALVQWQDGELRISSFENEKLAVSISVNNLSAIVASGNVKVRSMNQISTIDLDIQLKDNAQARLDARAVNISSSVASGSTLELSGESDNQHLSLSGESQYEASRFTTKNRSMVIADGAVASINQDGQSTSIRTFTNIPVKEDTLNFDPEF